MRVHLIAIGGSAMHNMAIALHLKGYKVTGSDDQIFEPSKSRLAKHGLLPDDGWDEANITSDIDAIILGMHAKKDNPELLKAQKLGLKIYSYPEYIYNQSKDKKRVVIGGSHGKTSITSMVLHVLTAEGMNPDFMVGAQLEGFDTMVKLTSDAEVIILEGDEYLSSPIDLRPKFHWYKPHIAVISGIAWDHINVFPTFDIYVEQFKKFIDLVDSEGVIYFAHKDEELNKICANQSICKPYQAHASEINEGITYLLNDDQKVAIKIFGNHNLENLSAALNICKELGVSIQSFYNHIATFKGASKRLEWVAQNKSSVCYKDFAHSPSKLSATTKAMKLQYPKRNLLGCMELHTFSSLTEEFLKEYKGCMDYADKAIVFFSPNAIKHKGLPDLDAEVVKRAFDHPNLIVFTNANELVNHLREQNWNNQNLLIMTSGNFEGVDINQLGKELLG